MSKNIIAIDGPAASGKGTLARSLAARLGFAHMDTGALYRATALEVHDAGLSAQDENDARDGAQILAQKIANAASPSDVLDNPALRTDQIGQQASIVAAHPRVREVLKNIQTDFAENPGKGYNGAILDGRDIGTIIVPDAPLKLFITANVEIRAKRRLKELQSRGIAATYGAVLKDMRERDARDADRKAAPMKPADDAIIIDSSDLNAGEMLEKAVSLAKERLKL
ncbi:MAG TPA: (d)CMP kinase [Alphaproteobacteria bacterium]|nr:(d)CMP kinase [Alphaproteobacteria bacterium]USO05308.1 MAG: (d)CMP kinase [Rhodospirillales bacterium]HOO81217.1 (d)CMP kinase [Alphaproteobacteria bacterium]